MFLPPFSINSFLIETGLANSLISTSAGPEKGFSLTAFDNLPALQSQFFDNFVDSFVNNNCSRYLWLHIPPFIVRDKAYIENLMRYVGRLNVSTDRIVSAPMASKIMPSRSEEELLCRR